MKKEIPPVVAVVVGVIVVLLIGAVFYLRSTSSGLNAEQKDKYTTPLTLPAPGQGGAVLPAPPPQNSGPTLPPQGGNSTLIPPPPPR